MVPYLYDARRVYTFVEGLLEPLRALVRSRIPTTLQEAMTCPKDLHGQSPRLEHPYNHGLPTHRRDMTRGPHHSEQSRGVDN